jgi:hypothetical protein
MYIFLQYCISNYIVCFMYCIIVFGLNVEIFVLFFIFLPLLLERGGVIAMVV